MLDLLFLDHLLFFKDRLTDVYSNAPVGAVLLFAMLVAPSVGWACACGCGVFDVGTSSMFPEGPGGMAFVEYD